MKICYFGTYDPFYTRNRLMIEGLKNNGVEVVECRIAQQKNKFIKYRQLIKLHQKLKGDYDLMVVGFAGHALMPLAWVLAKHNGKKVVLDLFVSEYDSVILDRKIYSRYSFSALKYYLMDWLACRLADVCLLDADEHIKFFVDFYKIKPEKFKTILLSCDEKIFYPQPRGSQADFIVHYHGSYSPIQGVSYIVKAAKLLENHRDIKFNIIGKSGNYKKEIRLAQELKCQNVRFLEAMPYEKLAEQIKNCDLVLGMFGDTTKALHCSAYKIVEGYACQKAVLTGDTPALREIVKDQVTGRLCRMADAKDLADKILELKNNKELRERIALEGYHFFLEYLTPQATGRDFKQVLTQLLAK